MPGLSPVNISIKAMALLLALVLFGCGGSTNDTGGDDNPNPDAGCPASPGNFPQLKSVVKLGVFTSIDFTPVGGTFPTSSLIDLEFLPGTGGDAIVADQSGSVYYVNKALNPLSQSPKVSTKVAGEQGLLNVAADPDYANNCFIYLYYTLSDGSGNQVDRLTVGVDHNASSFTLDDQQTIATFLKDEADSPGSNHNGGGLAFNDQGELLMSVGDGGGSSSANKTENVAQNTELGLGKVHRVVPSRTQGFGGFSIPPDGNNVTSNKWPSIYVFGLRNPFTITLGLGALFIGDVGSNNPGNSGIEAYEEVNLAQNGGGNFGWPQEEGPVGNPLFLDPIGGYSHTTGYNAAVAEDPEASAGGGHSIGVATLYTGNQYGGFLDNTVIFSELFAGFVRGLRLNGSLNVTSDDHLGHQEGITSLQEGPDGLLYGTSVFGFNRILRVDGVP